MGLDVGTTGVKAAAFNESGQLLYLAYRDYPLEFPAEGMAEINIELLWLKVTEAVRELNSNLSYDPVESLSVSSQGEGIVPVDGNGKNLDSFVVTFDNRTTQQVDWWRKEIDSYEIFKITGMPLHPMYSINKIMWFIKNKPAVHKKVWKYMCAQDYINFKLCSEAAIDYSLASRTMAFDIMSKKWSEKMIDKAGIEIKVLSNVYPSGVFVGYLSKKLQSDLGFKRKVKVITGGHDQACGSVGAGIISEGDAANSIGTVDVICPVFGKAMLDKMMFENNYCCYPHVIPDKYMSVAFNLTGGLLLKWYRDELCQSEKEYARANDIDEYSYIISMCSDKPVKIFILPHFVGSGTPELDSCSKGAIVGLTAAAKKADMTRALLDSLNYEMKYNIDRLKKCGVVINELRSTGGGARSPAWMQMKADLFGIRISKMEVSESAALGAAIIAAYGTGRYQTIEQSVKQMVKASDKYVPDMTKHKEYQNYYELYKKLYGTLKDFNTQLSLL